jgi:hypothetical protein
VRFKAAAAAGVGAAATATLDEKKKEADGEGAKVVVRKISKSRRTYWVSAPWIGARVFALFRSPLPSSSSQRSR